MDVLSTIVWLVHHIVILRQKINSYIGYLEVGTSLKDKYTIILSIY